MRAIPLVEKTDGCVEVSGEEEITKTHFLDFFILFIAWVIATRCIYRTLKKIVTVASKEK